MRGVSVKKGCKNIALGLLLIFRRNISVLILAAIFSFSILGIQIVNQFPKITTKWVAIYIASSFLFYKATNYILGKLELIRLKKNNLFIENIPKKCTLIVLVGCIVYFIAFSPANMFVDTYYQFTQIADWLPYGDWHPFAHTFFMKVIMDITGSPCTIVAIQILAYIYIIFIVFQELYYRGYKPTILYIFAVLLTFNIAFGISITNVWKDTMYTIMLLWLIVFMYFFTIYFRKNRIIPNQFKVIGCVGLTGVYLFRHNGFLVFFVTIFIMLFIAKYKRQVLTIVAPAILICWIVNVPIANFYAVEPNAKVTSYLPMIHGIAAVGKEIGWENLDDNTKELMNSLLPQQQWEDKYSQYNGDPYLFETNNLLQTNCEKYKTVDILKIYFKTFFKYPGIVIRDRLSGCELLWNLFPISDSYNYISGLEINNSNLTMDKRLKNFGIVQYPNSLTKICQNLFYFSVKSEIAGVILYRPAWLLVLYSIITMYVIKRKLILSPIILPIWLNIISLCIAMTFQAYRYIWFIFVCAPLTILLLLPQINDE